MNYLAHLYLSFGNEEHAVGNLSADFFKGNKGIKELPEGIQAGIRTHRRIDAFTDTHEVVKESKRRLYPHYSKYSSAIVDIYYDHLLANNWAKYSEESLEDFAEKQYKILEKYEAHLPERLRQRLPSMMQHNWLIGYRDMEGITTTFKYFAKRIKSGLDISQAHLQLQTDYDLYNYEFNRFFPELIEMVTGDS